MSMQYNTILGVRAFIQNNFPDLYLKLVNVPHFPKDGRNRFYQDFTWEYDVTNKVVCEFFPFRLIIIDSGSITVKDSIC